MPLLPTTVITMRIGAPVAVTTTVTILAGLLVVYPWAVGGWGCGRCGALVRSVPGICARPLGATYSPGEANHEGLCSLI